MAESYRPDLSPRGPLLDAARGALLPLKAFALCFRSGRLFLWALASAVVTAVALVGVVWLGGGHAGDLLGLVWARPESWYGSAVWYVATALTFVVLVLAGVTTVPLLLLSPLQDPMSEATEALCHVAPPSAGGLPGLVRSTATSLAHTAQRVLLLLVGHALLFLLNALPAAGAAVWALASTLWSAFWLAGEYLSIPAARHGHRFRAVVQALGRRPALALGFGLALYVLLWLPVLNFFLIPVAVVAGTLLYLGLSQAGELT